MAQLNVNIQMDEGTKQAFDLFCEEIGLSANTAFNIFAKTVVREQRIPFELTTEVPNAETRAAIREVQEFRANPENYKRYRSFDEILSEASQDA